MIIITDLSILNKIKFNLILIFYLYKTKKLGIGDWGVGIGDWGVGVGGTGLCAVREATFGCRLT